MLRTFRPEKGRPLTNSAVRAIAAPLLVLIANLCSCTGEVTSVSPDKRASGGSAGTAVQPKNNDSTPPTSGGSAGAVAGAGGGNSSGGVSSTGGTGDNDGTGGTGGGAVSCRVDPERIHADVAYLASDELRGRIPGDMGNQLALAFAEQEFIDAGLLPAGNNGTYRQEFPFTCRHSWCENQRSGITENVLGKIEGTDPELGREVIVVGAHIDHLGFSADGSIYRGADDNASGAAVVIELARMFERCALKPKRTLLFAQWNAEEMGIIGSRYYVAHPTLPLEDTIAAYNFDMVGGGDGSGVLLFGGNDTRNRWLTDLMINAAQAENLDHVIQLVPQKLASDHAPFVEKGIPICWGFSRPDPHPGYHTPNDDMSRVKVQSLRAVSELFWAALRPLATGEESDFTTAESLLFDEVEPEPLLPVLYDDDQHHCCPTCL